MSNTSNIRKSFTADERCLMWNVIANAAADFRKLAENVAHEPRIRDQFQKQAEMADKLAAEMEASL